MTKKKYVRYAIFLGIILSFLSCVKEATIIDFKPEKFDWFVDQPLIVKKENKLFFSVKNQEEKHIYSFKDKKRIMDNDVFVSPNSKKVVIIDDKTPKYLNINSGNKFKVITNDSIKSSYRNAELINNIQWDAFSEKICFITKTEHQDSCMLQVYDIEKSEITLKALIPEVHSFYFSKTGESIFYWDYYDFGKAIYYEISTATGEILSQTNEFNDSEVFINLFPSDLYNHTPDLKRRMIDGKSYDWRVDLVPGTYLQSADTLQLQIRGNWSGENFKGSTWSYHRTRNSYFLPEGRYYIFDVTSKQYNGGLLFDTKTKKYQKFDNSIKYYYAINSNHFGLTKDGNFNFLKGNYQNSLDIKDDIKILY